MPVYPSGRAGPQLYDQRLPHAGPQHLYIMYHLRAEDDRVAPRQCVLSQPAIGLHVERCTIGASSARPHGRTTVSHWAL